MASDFGASSTSKRVELFTEAMISAANDELQIISPQQRNSYISKECWDMIKERDEEKKKM